jgi:DNA/RNA endonuclease G (NUC1)
MKKLILIILITFFCEELKAQQQIIKLHGYTSYYNPKTLIPDSVIWIAKPHVKVAKRQSKFHATGDRPNLTNDYKHSAFDIGHNCDASDENGNKIDEYNSFDFANTFPQRPNNNRITWEHLEAYTRKLNQPVKVKVSWSGIIGKIGKDSVTVPKLTIKELWYNGHYEKYIMPNSDTCNKHDFKYYKMVRILSSRRIF